MKTLQELKVKYGLEPISITPFINSKNVNKYTKEIFNILKRVLSNNCHIICQFLLFIYLFNVRNKWLRLKSTRYHLGVVMQPLQFSRDIPRTINLKAESQAIKWIICPFSLGNDNLMVETIVKIIETFRVPFTKAIMEENVCNVDNSAR